MAYLDMASPLTVQAIYKLSINQPWRPIQVLMNGRRNTFNNIILLVNFISFSTVLSVAQRYTVIIPISLVQCKFSFLFLFFCFKFDQNYLFSNAWKKNVILKSIYTKYLCVFGIVKKEKENCAVDK